VYAGLAEQLAFVVTQHATPVGSGTVANVAERLAVRNLLDELRGGGQITRGPANFTAKDRQAFANQLDRWLTAAKG
jgi:uncharacterized protein YaiI (UPF0178 family)